MATPMAIVDDTIFSGITMRSGARGAVTGRSRARPRVLPALRRGIAPPLQALCPVTPGFAAPGRVLDEVSFIKRQRPRPPRLHPPHRPGSARVLRAARVDTRVVPPAAPTP